MYQRVLGVLFIGVLSCITADQSNIPIADSTHLPEHNDVHYPVIGEQYPHPVTAFGQVPHPPPPPPQFFFQQHPPEHHPLDINHDIHTNLIDHGDSVSEKKHREEERRLFEEVMQNKFEMNSLHSELAEMHHELEAFAQGKAFPDNINPEVPVIDNGGKSVIKTKLEGPPVKKLNEQQPKKDVGKTPIKKLLEDGKESLLSPFLNSLSEVLGGKGVGQHLVGLGSLVPIILVKIAAKFALITFSSKGLKALATLIPTIALLLINGIVLFLIWYQNFKARLGEHEFSDLFSNLFGNDGAL